MIWLLIIFIASMIGQFMILGKRDTQDRLEKELNDYGGKGSIQAKPKRIK